MSALSKLRSSPRALLNATRCIQKSNSPLVFNQSLQDLKCLQTLSSSSNGGSSFDLWQHRNNYSQTRGLFTKNYENIDEESGLPLQHPKKGTLVYTGRMSKIVRNLKILSLSTSLFSIGCQPFIMQAARDDMMVKAGILSTMCLMIFSTPVLLHFVTRKYVTDIYFNEETCTFTLAKKTFFLRRKEVKYTADDAKVALTGGLFVTHKIKGSPYFIEYTEFRSREIYLHMVGYDKPIDNEILDPNRHMKPKKFGLFEDEDDSKQTGTSIPWRSNMAMLDDDDDDDIVRKKAVKKNVN